MFVFSDVQYRAKVGYLDAWQEILCSSHILYPAVESIRMTLPLEYLAKNEYANMSVGESAPQNVVDALAARNYTYCNLCTLASFGKSALGEQVDISHPKSCN